MLDSGRELPADHPTVKTVLLGTRIVDPPSPATYLVGLGYVLVVYVVVQGGLGWTPGKLLAGVRLARDDGRRAGVPGAFVRWLVIDGVIGLFGVLMGLIDGWWPLRLLAADAAVLLVGGVVALVAGGRQPGDRLAGTLVVDEAALALRRASMPATAPSDAAAPDTTPPDATPTGPTPWAPAGPERVPRPAAPAGAAAAAAGATFVAGQAGPPEPVAEPAPVPSEAATGPTPLPQWPTSPPDQAAEGQPSAPAGTTGRTRPLPPPSRLRRRSPRRPTLRQPAPATPLGRERRRGTVRPPAAARRGTSRGTPGRRAGDRSRRSRDRAAATEPAAPSQPPPSQPRRASHDRARRRADAEPATTEEPEPDALVTTAVGSGGSAPTGRGGRPDRRGGNGSSGPSARVGRGPPRLHLLGRQPPGVAAVLRRHPVVGADHPGMSRSAPVGDRRATGPDAGGGRRGGCRPPGPGARGGAQPR